MDAAGPSEIQQTENRISGAVMDGTRSSHHSCGVSWKRGPFKKNWDFT